MFLGDTVALHLIFSETKLTSSENTNPKNSRPLTFSEKVSCSEVYSRTFKRCMFTLHVNFIYKSVLEQDPNSAFSRFPFLRGW